MFISIVKTWSIDNVQIIAICNLYPLQLIATFFILWKNWILSDKKGGGIKTKECETEKEFSIRCPFL